MKSYLKTYKIKLHTLSPVFVGSGQAIKKSEYVIDNGRLYVLDTGKLFERIVLEGLESSYISSLKRSGFSIKNWLYENGISDYENLTAYSLPCRYKVSDRDGIKVCIKDAYGRPYIPGSSLKGALRTVILWNKLTEIKRSDTVKIESLLNSAMRERNIKKEVGKVGSQIDKSVFSRRFHDNKKNKDEYVSIMRGLIVGDSKPLALDDLVLCKKIDISPEGKEKSPNTMRECIAPGREIEFDLTVDESVLGFSAEDLKEMIEFYANDYYDTVTSKFGHGENDENVIFLGGGAGYFSKTVMYSGALFTDKNKTLDFVKNYLGRTTPKEHKHFKDNVISPHMQKCTRLNGKVYEMGKCRVEITGGGI